MKEEFTINEGYSVSVKWKRTPGVQTKSRTEEEESILPYVKKKTRSTTYEILSL